MTIRACRKTSSTEFKKVEEEGDKVGEKVGHPKSSDAEDIEATISFQVLVDTLHHGWKFLLSYPQN